MRSTSSIRRFSIFGAHLGLEAYVAAAARGLRLVERDVGLAHHIVERAARLGEGDADRGIGLDQMADDAERRAEAVADIGEQGLGIVGCRGRLRITANSSPPRRAMKSPSRDRVAQPVGEAADQLVAGMVAERVVDVLEAVDVDAGDGERMALARRPRR